MLGNLISHLISSRISATVLLTLTFEDPKLEPKRMPHNNLGLGRNNDRTYYPDIIIDPGYLQVEYLPQIARIHLIYANNVAPLWWKTFALTSKIFGKVSLKPIHEE